MVELYWFCFVAGAVFAVLLVLFDSVVGGWLDGVLDALPDAVHPMLLVGGIVAFGGSGILFTEYSPLPAWEILLCSFLLAVLLAAGLFFFYVKPMTEAENSVAYSVTELPGKLGEVTVPIPVGGYGEVGFSFGHGIVCEIANSTEDVELKAGERVLALEVKDGVVTVCLWTEGLQLHT